MPTATRHKTRRTRTAPPAGAALATRCETGVAVEKWRTWKAAFREPTTVATQHTLLAAWVRTARLSSTPVSRLTYEHVDAWVNPKTDLSLASLRLRLTTARDFFTFCQRQGYIAGNPAELARIRYKQIPIQRQRPHVRRALTPAEYQQIIRHLRPRPTNKATHFLHAATILSYWTGMRLSDCAQLEWASILPHEIVVRTDKDEELLALPLDNPLIGSIDLALLLMDLEAGPRSDPRFVFPQARAVQIDPRRRQRWPTYFARILQTLGIADASFHSLRHAFTARLRAAGVTEKGIGRLMGHSSEKLTAGYGQR